MPFIYNVDTDTTELKEQSAYFKSTFPKNYIESVEGQTLIEKYEIALHPLKTNQTAPQFTINTIDGKRISLDYFKGKYVLLDVWATWCGPCVNEIPFIKDIRKKYPEDILAIIGISQDRNLDKLKEMVKQKDMNWFHFFDKETEISRLYGINSFPTLVLIDKEGKIIYKSDSVKNDGIELPKLLNNIN